MIRGGVLVTKLRHLYNSYAVSTRHLHITYIKVRHYIAHLFSSHLQHLSLCLVRTKLSLHYLCPNRPCAAQALTLTQ
jgi:hypothetical protein